MGRRCGNREKRVFIDNFSIEVRSYRDRDMKMRFREDSLPKWDIHDYDQELLK